VDRAIGYVSIYVSYCIRNRDDPPPTLREREGCRVVAPARARSLQLLRTRISLSA